MYVCMYYTLCRNMQDVFAVSESQDVLGGGALQQLNFDPLPSPLQPSTPPSNQSLSPSPTRQEPRQQVVPPATRHVVPQPPVVLHGGQPQSTQPRTHRGNDRLAHVPSISEISSSQSSDEDLRLRRPPVLPSSLLRSHSACLPVQRLDQPTSESSGTDGTDQAVVPDPERQRQAALERANRNPQAVPKAPSRLRKELVCHNAIVDTMRHIWTNSVLVHRPYALHIIILGVVTCLCKILANVKFRFHMFRPFVCLISSLFYACEFKLRIKSCTRDNSIPCLPESS